eukprot:TRINITY_DN20294_c0_g2_i2.p5 TRINITY_DN20294_c0_g2~~TRINITY_DN20294_c0_g2_i2.p5  ORF type:complete len:148 (-),score=21.08 TRINITY_DN20294_c0_g2_i2:1023-1445(-)
MFWAAGYSFSSSQLIVEVPYPRPNVVPFLFNGEEMMMLVRMMSRGWAVWTPPECIAWHQWSRKYRHTFWQEVEGNVEEIGRDSRSKVLELIINQTGSELLEGIGPHTLSEILQSLCVDFKSKSLGEKALSGGIQDKNLFL